MFPVQDPADVFDKLTTYLTEGGFEDVQVRRLGSMSPAKTDPDDPMVKLALDTGEEVYGKRSLITPLKGVSSPIYAIAEPLQIPVIRVGVGYWDNRGHAPDEHVRIVDFLNATRHIARILAGFADL